MIINTLLHIKKQMKLRSFQRIVQDRFDAPLIIIGMHRSGTSLVTRILRQSGCYFGRHLNNDSEERNFWLMNERLLNTLGMTWHQVGKTCPFSNKKDRYDQVYNTIWYHRNLIDGFFNNLGQDGQEQSMPEPKRLRVFAHNKPQWQKKNKNIVWGWKDPRTTLTLAVWLEIFQNAKVLHIVRNGADCALSMWRRSRKRLYFHGKCTDMVYAFRLWEYYVQEGERWKFILNDRYYQVHYEDLVRDASSTIQGISDHFKLNLKISSKQLDLIDKRKLYQNDYSQYPSLLKVIDQSKLMKNMGYGSICG